MVSFNDPKTLTKALYKFELAVRDEVQFTNALEILSNSGAQGEVQEALDAARREVAYKRQDVERYVDALFAIANPKMTRIERLVKDYDEGMLSNFEVGEYVIKLLKGEV